MQGDIDEAMKLCYEHYPSVLENNPFVLFRLKCRRFIEMVKQAQNQQKWMIDTAEEETQRLKIAHSLSSKRDMEQTGYTRQKKQKIDSMDLFTLAMNYGNQLREAYAKQAETDENIKKELMVKKESKSVCVCIEFCLFTLLYISDYFLYFGLF